MDDESGFDGEGEKEGEGEEEAGLPRFARNDGREGDDQPAPEAAADKDERIHSNKNRALQVARTGGRKLFDEAAKKVFLEWFAATCNLSLSAERAGFNYKTACRHYVGDPDFAAAWDQAVRLGVARLKAKQLETKQNQPKIGVEGDLDAPEMDDIDPALAMQLIREHDREIKNGRSKPGRRPRVATNAEVRAALVKRLVAFGIRVSEDPASPEASASAEATADRAAADRAADGGAQ